MSPINQQSTKCPTDSPLDNRMVSFSQMRSLFPDSCSLCQVDRTTYQESQCHYWGTWFTMCILRRHKPSFSCSTLPKAAHWVRHWGLALESWQFALDSCFLMVVLSAARLSPVPVFSHYLFNGLSGSQSPARQVHSQSRQQPQRSKWQSRDPQAERDNRISGKPQGTTIKGWVEEDWAEDSKDSWSSRVEGRKFWNKSQRYLRTREMNAFAGVK